jgi:Recombination endonuclease VII
MPARKWTDEQRRALSKARMGANNPAWKGGPKTKEQTAAYLRQWRKDNESYVRNREYQKRFGITLAEYKRRLKAQNGRCAICNSKPGRRRLEVDHCHETGRVRGLLCEMCNRGLGTFEDNVALLLAAANYLEGGD